MSYAAGPLSGACVRAREAALRQLDQDEVPIAMRATTRERPSAADRTPKSSNTSRVVTRTTREGRFPTNRDIKRPDPRADLPRSAGCSGVQSVSSDSGCDPATLANRTERHRKSLPAHRLKQRSAETDDNDWKGRSRRRQLPESRRRSRKNDVSPSRCPAPTACPPRSGRGNGRSGWNPMAQTTKRWPSSLP